MSDQEFTAHMDKLIPTPSVEVNISLLDLANSLCFELKEDLYHTFSFIWSACAAKASKRKRFPRQKNQPDR